MFGMRKREWCRFHPGWDLDLGGHSPSYLYCTDGAITGICSYGDVEFSNTAQLVELDAGDAKYMSSILFRELDTSPHVKTAIVCKGR